MISAAEDRATVHLVILCVTGHDPPCGLEPERTPKATCVNNPWQISVDTAHPTAALACNKFTEDFRDFVLNYSLSHPHASPVPVTPHERIK
jgi:hypothetical protein